MATARDVADVIQSALDEIGVTGTLSVLKDDETAARSLGEISGDDVKVDVEMHDISDAA